MESKEFTGTFDGNGHSISGLDATAIASGSEDVRSGMFAILGDGASVKNLTLVEGHSISMGLHVTAYAGAIAASVSDGASVSISGCGSAQGVHAISDGVFAGGMIGYAGNASVALKDCVNRGNVSSFTQELLSAEPEASDPGSDPPESDSGQGLAASLKSAYSGGLIGDASGTVSISGCFNYGRVSSDNWVEDAAAIAASGGMLGHSGCISLKISDSGCSGKVVAHDGPEESDAGGLVGHAVNGGSIDVQRCYNSGEDVTSGGGAATESAFSGGLFGHLVCDSGKTLIKDCYNSGSLSSTGANANSGGIAGYIEGNGTVAIANAYNAGKAQSTAVGDGSSRNGNIVAKDEGSLVLCNVYWLSGMAASGKGVAEGSVTAYANGSSSDGQGELDAEKMRSKSSYPSAETAIPEIGTIGGWDFVDVWRIDQNNSGFPYLHFQTFSDDGQDGGGGGDNYLAAVAIAAIAIAAITVAALVYVKKRKTA
jgi:hypothetical protein